MTDGDPATGALPPASGSSRAAGLRLAGRLRSLLRTPRRATFCAGAVLLAVLVALAVSPRLRHLIVRSKAKSDVPAVDLFELEPRDWAPGRYTFAPHEFTFSPDRMKAPPAELVEEWTRAHPLVRPVPYPYFAGLSVPSDCCGSSVADLYYSGMSISRRFGLDLPSSFWMYSCQPNDSHPAVYIADPASPGRGLIPIEGDEVDRFALLLTYYYRGWLDHLHQWSAEAGVAHSLVTPRRLEIDSARAASSDLQLGAIQHHPFRGLEIDVELSPDLGTAELDLVDDSGVSHAVVFGAGLGGRPGWEVSDRSRGDLRRLCLMLDRESNANGSATLGVRDRLQLKSARLTATGAPGAFAHLHKVRPIDLTRECVRTQLGQARDWNLLPTCETNHGGNSSWCQLDDWNQPITYRDPVSKHVSSLERKPLGATPGSPSYCADLLGDSGLIFHSQKTGPGFQFERPSERPEYESSGLCRVWTRQDRKSMYCIPRGWITPTAEYPDVVPDPNGNSHFETLGGLIVRCISGLDAFGHHSIVYSHFNIYNPHAFAPPADGPVQMSQARALQPYLERALQTLADLKYDLDGRRGFHQRVWVCPLSVAARFGQAQRALAAHARRVGSVVRVEPWRDEVTGRAFPDPDHLGQDLHGQTFYVPDARIARVFCGDREVTSLRRNPPDFTGRPSVSVVDTETPTIVFDEVPLEDALGAVEARNSRVAYPEGDAPRGRHSMTVTALGPGEAVASCKPSRFNNHETDLVRLFYRKSNPSSAVSFSWVDSAGREYAVTEGSLGGRQGWEIGRHADAGYREVVLDYADMARPADGDKAIPRGSVAEFRFGLGDAQAGDVASFDRVEFLSARGLRPHGGGGLVVGGRLSNRRDGAPVRVASGSRVWETRTEHGGWYFVRGIPPDSAVEITSTVNGRTCRPERGRVCQIGRNDVEYHIRVKPD